MLVYQRVTGWTISAAGEEEILIPKADRGETSSEEDRETMENMGIKLPIKNSNNVGKPMS